MLHGTAAKRICSLGHECAYCMRSIICLQEGNIARTQRTVEAQRSEFRRLGYPAACAKLLTGCRPPDTQDPRIITLLEQPYSSNPTFHATLFPAKTYLNNPTSKSKLRHPNLLLRGSSKTVLCIRRTA